MQPDCVLYEVGFKSLNTVSSNLRRERQRLLRCILNTYWITGALVNPTDVHKIKAMRPKYYLKYK